MNLDDGRLLRHLGTAVAMKLALLAALWWGFVRDGAVDASSEQTAAHLATAATTAATRPSNAPTTKQEPAQ